jgi:hypothetical protein
VNGAGKITASHRGRLALIYVRQSSPVQVREHTESTGRQYGLAETAIELGWAPGGAVVVDADLLRTLIADVTVLPASDRSQCRVGVRWHTSAADEIAVERIGPAAPRPPRLS